jgi:tetratricopeptide (TPR) repeat protein
MKASYRTEVGLLLDAAKEAEKVLEQEARSHPTYADVRHRLGLLRLLRGDAAGGEREFEEALGINPGYRAAYYGLRLARMLQGLPPGESLAAGDREQECPEEIYWKLADEYYAGVVTEPGAGEQEGPTDDETQAALTRHYAFHFALRKGDMATARERLESAVSSEASREAFGRLGFYPWPGDLEAAARCEQLLWTPLAEDLYSYLAGIYARNGLREKAVDCYDRSYCVFPRRAQHAMHRAELAAAFGRESQAIVLLTEAIEADPTCVPARMALGYEYASQGYLEEARAQFEVASSLKPGYADVRYNLGLLNVGEGRVDEALDEFRRALTINPGYLPARHSMAHLLCRAGRYEEGLREYGRILKQGFQSSDMLVQMGKAAMALDRPEESLQFLERAIFLNPEFAPSYYYVGQAYQRKGLKKKARSAWRTYLEKANDWEPLGPIPVEEQDWAS